MLLGCNVPVVLGKCQYDWTHFNLKGGCFVEGWMRVEMLETFWDMTDEETVDNFTLKKTLIQIH
jgi:hypothetical protein